ncbi:SHOCT domain-containing protein [Dactylosporangium sp. CA-139114]|uniref:SHOCT domain-containing protein n=1 Tax=Dactylosporangium sp. CA-139114 TaxID=3239931 RepID=UPI003D972AA0
MPQPGWRPDPTWPPAPAGWQLIVDTDAEQTGPHLPVPWIAGEVVPSAPVPAAAPVPVISAPSAPVIAAPSAPPAAPFVPANDARTAAMPTVPGVPAVPAQEPLEPGVLWAAKGQPLSGIGAGRYKLTATTLYFEKGALSTRAQQIPIVDLMDVDMSQSITQKARNVGNLVLHVNRPQGRELVTLEDVPSPRDALAKINAAVHDARLLAQQRANTHHYVNGAPPVPVVAAVPAVPPPAEPVSGAVPLDPIEQLRRLGELRDAGILTDEEFAAKKAEILSRI